MVVVREFVGVAVLRQAVNGFGVGVEQDAFELTEDHPTNHSAQLFVFLCERYVGPYLSARITQPHSVNISCINECIVVAVDGAVMDGGIERVREAVFEHPCQLRVSQQFFDTDNLFFDCFRRE